MDMNVINYVVEWQMYTLMFVCVPKQQFFFATYKLLIMIKHLTTVHVWLPSKVLAFKHWFIHFICVFRSLLCWNTQLFRRETEQSEDRPPVFPPQTVKQLHCMILAPACRPVVTLFFYLDSAKHKSCHCNQIAQSLSGCQTILLSMN